MNEVHVIQQGYSLTDSNGKYRATGSKSDQVVILPTVGHTSEDISVVVHNTQYGTVVIAGDLFECENDEDSWKDVSQFPDKQAQNRDSVLQVADWIVPGHGAMFKVKK
ncbi:metallo-beta-lactamase domain-containing protein 1-like [Actinia tenebrosa]|uniref:Metallo-beta-lactamase domain-containing protein 1-like n=1 Tax=Actinia tenebrosa TaxID=6105 RepID=A0A6P8HGL4_ACTTE|nr:metallo-beta-lactamase domain-containing protein 1-like [Actinia tenebrosa]